jgi:hypothetical protein
MKNYLPLLILLIVIACNNKTDKKPEGPASSNVIDTTEVINGVLRYADDISNNPSLFIRDSVSLEGLSTEGGEMIVYKTKDSSAKLLEAKNYGEMGQNEEKIWLSADQPALQYLKDINYDKPMYEPGSKISNTSITYIVFRNGSPFAMLDSARQLMKVDSVTFRENVERIKAVLPDYLSQAGIKQ